MRSFFQSLANSKDNSSLVTRLRKKRFEIFEKLVNRISDESKQVVKVLDVGGTLEYWKQVYDIKKNPLNLSITILNLEVPIKSEVEFVEFYQGNAKSIPFGDCSYDICFSNSLIEHVGGFEQQCIAANEMKRVGKEIYLQTPNFFFPWEPYYQLPFIHFLPFSLVYQNL